MTAIRRDAVNPETGEVTLADLTPQERGQLAARGWRDRRADEWPPVANDCRPADYQHDLDRGTVDYDPTWRNYSYHRVRVPAGTTIRGCNFSQARPRTPAILVTGNPATVTLEECNLVNVLIHPAWRLVNCNTAQSWLVRVTGPDGEAREERRWIARHSDHVPATARPPTDAVLSREF